MIEIFEQKICAVPSERVYAWILDISSYQTWVPFCVESGIIRVIDDSTHEAFMTMQIGLWKEKLITRNTMIANKKITMELVEGPFQSFLGQWFFVPQGDRITCVQLKISAELKLWGLEPAVKMAIAHDRDRILNLLCDRFFV